MSQPRLEQSLNMCRRLSSSGYDGVSSLLSFLERGGVILTVLDMILGINFTVSSFQCLHPYLHRKSSIISTAKPTNSHHLLISSISACHQSFLIVISSTTMARSTTNTTTVTTTITAPIDPTTHQPRLKAVSQPSISYVYWKPTKMAH